MEKKYTLADLSDAFWAGNNFRKTRYMKILENLAGYSDKEEAASQNALRELIESKNAQIQANNHAAKVKEEINDGGEDAPVF